ncbi:MAG: T9SS type A sorting domain-containing protein [bacterium]
MKIFSIIVIILIANNLFGGAGFFEDAGNSRYQKVTFNFGGSDEWKRIVTEIDGVNYGEKTTSDIWTFKGGEAFIWASEGTTITAVTLYYRIYKSGSTPGSFTGVSLNQFTFLGGNDWRYYNTSATINILDNSVINSSGTWYVEFYYDATTSNAGTVFWSNSGSNYKLNFYANATFPIELTSFAAVAMNGLMNLSWQTATEINNYGFEIERNIPLNPPPSKGCWTGLIKGDAASSGGDWKILGFVQGSGNSNSTKQYSFIDENPPAGKLQYRLKQIDTDGSISYSSIVEATCNLSPSVFGLMQNYPNPFNPGTTIKYSILSGAETGYIPSLQHVTLRIYDLLGNEVATLVNETKAPGIYEVEFNAANLPSGIYFYKIQTPEFWQVRKMLLIK